MVSCQKTVFQFLNFIFNSRFPFHFTFSRAMTRLHSYLFVMFHSTLMFKLGVNATFLKADETYREYRAGRRVIARENVK